MHIEKPHVVNYSQLSGLMDAMKKNPSANVFLGSIVPKLVVLKATFAIESTARSFHD